MLKIQTLSEPTENREYNYLKADFDIKIYSLFSTEENHADLE